MVFIIFAVAIVLSLILGFIVGYGARCLSLMRKVHRRAAAQILSKIGNKTVNELLTHEDDLLRQYGITLQGSVSDGLLNQMWNEVAIKDKLGEKLSSQQFYLRLWPIISVIVLLITLVICSSIFLYHKLFIDAGFHLQKFPSSYTETWVK